MEKLEVLFDWDDPNPNPVWSIKRGIKLILYGCFSLVHMRPKFLSDMYKETDEYAIAITKLNELLGVNMIYGVRDNVLKDKRSLIESFRASGRDVRRHVHIGEPPDPNRKRLWEPTLIQSMDTWHYDRDWIAGKKVQLREGEHPIWHFDTPYYFCGYIDFLYAKLKEEEKK